MMRSMKTLSSKQLGGACDQTFTAATFEEMAAIGRTHGKEMMASGDQPHIAAMQGMMKLLQSPEAMHAWMEDKKRLFEEA